MSFSQVVSVLVKKPFNLTPKEVGELTPFQLRHIFFRAEEATQPSGPKQSPKELIHKLFVEACVAKGQSQAEAEQLWQADTQKRQSQKQARLQALEAQRAQKRAEALAKWQQRRREDRLDKSR